MEAFILNSNTTFNKAYYDNFWNGFRDHLKKESWLNPFETYDPQEKENDKYHATYQGVEFGNFNTIDEKQLYAWLTGYASCKKRTIAARFRLRHNASLYERLHKDKVAIGDYFGDRPLHWWEGKTQKGGHGISVYMTEEEFMEASDEKELFEWLRIALEDLDRVFTWILASYYIEREAATAAFSKIKGKFV